MYRVYRIEDISQHHTPRETSRACNYIKQMAPKLSNRHVSGTITPR